MNFKTKIIKIAGKNLEGFFQNLVTNDIKLLKNNQALYSAMLTPQGKFLADFIILEKNNFFFIETNSQNVSEIINLFTKYDLRKSLKISEEKDIKTYCTLYDELPLDIQVQLKKLKIIQNDNFFIFSDGKNDYLVSVGNKKY